MDDIPLSQEKTEINDTRFDPKKGKGEKALNVEGKEGGKEGGQEGGECDVMADMKDAEWAAEKIGVDFKVVSFVKEYWNDVFTYMMK